MPPRRPGPKSRTAPQENSGQSEESSPTPPPPPPVEQEHCHDYDLMVVAEVYGCKYCSRVFGVEKDLLFHKLMEHLEEAQDHLARMEQKQKLQEKQEAAERKREQHLKDRAEYQKLQNRAWAEKVIKPKEYEQPGRKLPTGSVCETALMFGNSGFAKPNPLPSAVPKHMKVPIPAASSCPDINKNSGAVAGSSMNKGVSAGNIWTGISSTISSAMAFVKPQAPNKLPVMHATSKVVEQEKKLKTPPESCLDDTFQSCDTTFNSTLDVNVSTYDITDYEDYDENLAHRENKRIPKWASDSEKLKRCLFMQQPKYIAMLEREVLPPQKIGYKIFPRRRDIVEEDEASHITSSTVTGPVMRPGGQSEESSPAPPPPPPVEQEVERASQPPSSHSHASASSSKGYRCKYCGREYAEKNELGYHKWIEHLQEASHITSSTVTGPVMRPGFRLPFVPPRPPPPPPSGRRSQDNDDDSELEPRRRRSPPPSSSRRPPEDEDTEPTSRPNRGRRSPPPPKRSRCAAQREEEETDYVDPLPVLRNQGRNKPPKMHGRRIKVRGVDGVERVEYVRSERTNGG